MEVEKLDQARILASLIVDGADVLALGESAHGARDVFIVRAELTKRLILDGWARALILEADAWDVCALERKILPMAKEAESGT
jgi:erythromycin esterase-like protein